LFFACFEPSDNRDYNLTQVTEHGEQMAKRSDGEWIAELRGDQGREVQRRAHEDLAAYLYTVAYNYLELRRGNVPILREFASEDLAALAQDFVQDTLEKIARDRFTLLEQYDRAGAFTSWAAAIVKREAGQELRKSYWTRRVPLPEVEQIDKQPTSNGISPAAPETPEQKAILQEIGTALQRCLEKLPENRRLAFLLCVREDQSAEEVAGVLGNTPNAVLIQVHRAKRALRECLAVAGLAEDILQMLAG
jgi:RNA polymerase sigma factor (sigma-70 family)